MFLPRISCGHWPTFLIVTYFLVQLLIAYSYFKIPYDLRRLQTGREQREEGIGHSQINWLFISFIAFCGLGHLLDALSLWYVNYYIMTLINLFTAVVSYVTSRVLPKYVLSQLEKPTQKQLEIEIQKRVEKETETRFLKKINLALNREVVNLKEKVSNLETPISDLDQVLENLKSLRINKDAAQQ